MSDNTTPACDAVQFETDGIHYSDPCGLLAGHTGPHRFGGSLGRSFKPGVHPDCRDASSARCLNCGELGFTNYRGIHHPEYRHARTWAIECPETPDPDYQEGGKFYRFVDRVYENGRQHGGQNFKWLVETYVPENWGRADEFAEWLEAHPEVTEASDV